MRRANQVSFLAHIGVKIGQDCPICLAIREVCRVLQALRIDAAQERHWVVIDGLPQDRIKHAEQFLRRGIPDPP